MGILTTCIKRVYSEEAEGAKNRLFETDNNELPTTVLGNLMNCLISLVHEIRGMARDYTEFFLIFYELAKCGQETAHYLLGKKTIGRLVEFFCGYVRDLHDVFRKLNDVKFAEFDEENGIGEPAEVRKKVLSGFEELKQRKKEKMLMDYNTSSKIYLWQTVCELLLYCKANLKSESCCKWQKTEQAAEIMPEERALLKQDSDDFIDKVWSDAKAKGSVKAISTIYAYLSFEDEKFTGSIVSNLEKGLLKKHLNDFRFMFALIKKLLSLDDSLQTMRVTYI